LVRSDCEELRRLFNREEVARFLWDGRVLATSDVEGLLEKNEELFDRETLGLWGVYRRARREDLIGFAGFWYFHQPPQRELLYGLRGDAWGQGLATEAAKAIAGYGVDRLGIRRLVASADVPNEASHRVMERLGMIFDRRALDECLDTVWYVRELTRSPDEWEVPELTYSEGPTPP